MKKTLILSIFFLLLCNLSAETLNGIFGCTLGSSKKDVIKQMQTKGWNIENTEDYDVEFSKENGTYAGLKVRSILTNFSNGKLEACFVYVDDDETDSRIQNTLKTIIKNYDLKFLEHNEDEIMVSDSYLSGNDYVFSYLTNSDKDFSFKIKTISIETYESYKAYRDEMDKTITNDM